MQDRDTAVWYLWHLKEFLADRTNDRAYAAVLRPSVVVVVCLWRYVLWLNGVS